MVSMTSVNCFLSGLMYETKVPSFCSFPTPCPCFKYCHPISVNCVVWAAIIFIKSQDKEIILHMMEYFYTNILAEIIYD